MHAHQHGVPGSAWPASWRRGLYPGSGRLSATPPEISNPAIAAGREQTSPAADAAIGRSAALVGSSPRRASERRCATRSCALSCDDGASAFVWRESRTEQAADQPRGCERQMPAPTRAPTCQAMLQRASRRTSACWGTSRLTVCRIGNCCDSSVARFRDGNLNGNWDFPETPATSDHDRPWPSIVGCDRVFLVRSWRSRPPMSFRVNAPRRTRNADCEACAAFGRVGRVDRATVVAN